jgi:hypothetical protein
LCWLDFEKRPLRRIFESTHQEFDSRIVPREEFASILQPLVGARITQMTLDPKTLTLHVSFGDSRIKLLADPLYGEDSWLISLPTKQTIAFDGSHHWSLSIDLV